MDPLQFHEMYYYNNKGTFFDNIISLKQYLNEQLQKNDTVEFKIQSCSIDEIYFMIHEIVKNGTIELQSSGCGTYLIIKQKPMIKPSN